MSDRKHLSPPVQVSSMSTIMAPINPAGYPFIAIFAAVTLALFLFVGSFLGWIGVVLTIWCAYFFRDPKRVTPLSEHLIISPADGRVQAIEDCVPPPELLLGDKPRTRISVFMNVFDVHVNRVPISGTFQRIEYKPGKFFNASLDKASEFNERCSYIMHDKLGREVVFVQIAGLVARRIKWDVSSGDMKDAGDRFGLIRFGSRVDVYLPDDAVPRVMVGQRALAGETVLADYHNAISLVRGRHV
ncbi:MAG: phosphatidylserine decarboxylase [Alphaproteobacteria bacterium]